MAPGRSTDPGNPTSRRGRRAPTAPIRASRLRRHTTPPPCALSFDLLEYAFPSAVACDQRILKVDHAAPWRRLPRAEQQSLIAALADQITRLRADGDALRFVMKDDSVRCDQQKKAQ